jgi:hypothetical protein
VVLKRLVDGEEDPLGCRVGTVAMSDEAREPVDHWWAGGVVDVEAPACGVVRRECEAAKALLLTRVADEPVTDVEKDRWGRASVGETRAPHDAVLGEEERVAPVAGDRLQADHLVEVELRKDLPDRIGVGLRAAGEQHGRADEEGGEGDPSSRRHKVLTSHALDRVAQR